MSIADERTAPGTFGSGGSEPYAMALRPGGSGVLYLREARLDGPDTTATMDVSRWHARADAADLSLLARVRGPVLDIGCGPGRMVRASMESGLTVLGIDVSPAAIALSEQSGLRVLERSVFDRLPSEGQWQTALLVDGNIGIGGNVSMLLSRCRELLAADGEIVAELHPDACRDRTYTGRIVDPAGNESASFPWAEIGVERLRERARGLALELRQSWMLADRSFCRLAAIAR